MRATRDTELRESFRSHEVDAWIGHDEAVAKRNDLRITDQHCHSHFDRSANACFYRVVRRATSFGPQTPWGLRDPPERPSRWQTDSCVSTGDGGDGTDTLPFPIDVPCFGAGALTAENRVATKPAWNAAKLWFRFRRQCHRLKADGAKPSADTRFHPQPTQFDGRFQDHQRVESDAHIFANNCLVHDGRSIGQQK